MQGAVAEKGLVWLRAFGFFGYGVSSLHSWVGVYVKVHAFKV